MVDYCDRYFFGVRYRAVLSEDRLGRGQNHVDSLASFRGFCPEVLGGVSCLLQVSLYRFCCSGERHRRILAQLSFRSCRTLLFCCR